MKTRILTLIAAAVAVLALPACTSTAPVTAAGAVTTQTSLQKTLAAIKSFEGGVKLDLASPQGKKLLATVFAGALTVSAEAATGQDIAAVTSGLSALGGTLEAYSTLPTTSAQLQQVAAAGTGVATVAQSVVPAVAQIIDAAEKTGADPTAIIQAVAGGVYAATGVPAS